MDARDIVSKLSKTQKKAILLFGETYNKYRYHDSVGMYGEPFLWCDSRFTPESAPSNVLDSLRYSSKFGDSLTFPCFSLYSGDYFFLTEKGKEVLEYLKSKKDSLESIHNYVKDIKRDSRPPGGLRVY